MLLAEYHEGLNDEDNKSAVTVQVQVQLPSFHLH
jgi:hypothetical protein